MAGLGQVHLSTVRYNRRSVEVNVEWKWVEGVALLAFNVLVVLIWKPWAGSYAGEKGKNLARKEDLNEILAEVRAVTVTQREIEAKISGELWDRQMHWTQKKELYGQLVKCVNDLADTYGRLSVTLRSHQQQDVRDTMESLYERHTGFGTLSALAMIFASEACNTALREYHGGRAFPDLVSAEWAESESTSLARLLGNIVPAAQEDLGVARRPA